MFPEKELFEYVLIELAEQLASRDVPAPEPMLCDRWIARSAMQKGCRRAEVDVAQRALARIFVDDPQSVWRHLTVIALEDVGVANIDVLARITAARLNRTWRNKMGGDWAVASLLVRQIAESNHCQAACDLLLVAINQPDLERARDAALEAPCASLADTITDQSFSLDHQGIAALALGGGLAEGQPCHDPHAVFDVLSEQSYASHVIATCRAAWRGSRNPMALLLPLVWQQWEQNSGCQIADDPMPQVRMTNGVPGYAIDQFTRTGGQVARAFLAGDHETRTILDSAGIPRTMQHRVIGDLQFLIEGGQLRRRLVWQDADRLRLPHRALAGTFQMGDKLQLALKKMIASGKAIATVRARYLCQ
ncbi:MAG: hypothetical protein JWO15_105 [Sphingomonadales bacterium]|nr:hypothetical protein [Sphingomonadales bacterium]